MSDPTDYEVWVTKASHDYITATDMMQRHGAELADIICFHCQQAAEKYIKAILVQQRIGFPKTHDLVRLIEIGEPRIPSLRTLEPSAAQLVPFATEIRYSHQWTGCKGTTRSLDGNERHSCVLPTYIGNGRVSGIVD